MSFVKAKYKTGIYIGKVIQVEEEQNRALFQVFAVESHPKQGDLHNPKQVDVPYFHQRKALSYLEKTWVPYTTVKPYEGDDVPDYKESLERAWTSSYEALQKDDSEWAKKSVPLLEELKKEYHL